MKRLQPTRVGLRALSCLAALGSLFISSQAFALQPLDDFIQASHKNGFDAREQDAVAEQRRHEAQAALGRLLPSLTAQANLTHNQVEAELPAGTFPGQTEAVVITPQNQFDAVFRLDIPLLNFENFARYDQAKHVARAEEYQKEVVTSQLDSSVAQSYFTYVGGLALVQAAEDNLKLAQDNLDFVEARHGGGVATDLDLARATANLERAKRDLADAQLIGITAARNLQTLSGLTPEAVEAFPIDDLHREAPLDAWLNEEDTPFDRVAEEYRQAASAGRKAARRAFIPVLSANAQERISNATGFAGQSAVYTLQAVLNWRLDYSMVANSRAQNQALRAAEVRKERTRRNVSDAIYNAYYEVDASIAKSRSARAEADSAKQAAELSSEGYESGIATQLDVTQSQRDALQAQAARIKADADLAFARVRLRVAAGMAPDATGPEGYEGQAPEATETTPAKQSAGLETQGAVLESEATLESDAQPSASEPSASEPTPSEASDSE